MKQLLIFTLLLLTAALPAEAKNKSRKKAKTEQAGKADSAKMSRYDRLFKDKKTTHLRERGIMELHLYGDKLYLEIPDSLLGHELLLSSVIEKSSETPMIGAAAAFTKRIVIERNDTALLFRTPKYNIRTEKGASANEALKLSRISTIDCIFPIQAVNKDSTALVIDATAFFKGENKAIFDIELRYHSEGVAVYKADQKSAMAAIDAIEAFDNSVSVLTGKTAKLTLLSLPHNGDMGKPMASFAVRTSISRLANKPMPIRQADPRIGTGYVTSTCLKADKGSENEYFATRRNLKPGEHVTFYVDTLFRDGWRKALETCAKEWNKAFAEIGFGTEVIRLETYPRTSAFNANDPMVNCIMFGNNTNAAPSCRNLSDPRTGEILSSHMILPRNFAETVRREGIFDLCDVDTRFCNYYLPDDLIDEAVVAYMLPVFGRSLGLGVNYAGDKAYTPEQLRSPSFTQRNGITASVMSSEKYNYLARPGDKERGVQLMATQIGPYDKYAIKWLYSPIEGDEKATLNRWISEKEGDDIYFCGRKLNSIAADPRCQSRVLGNDPFAAIDAKFEHLKYIVKNGDKWFDDADIPHVYKELFPEFVFLEVFYQIHTLSTYIGGLYLNEPRDDKALPTFQSVPRSVQEQAVRKIFDVLSPERIAWMNSNLAFLTVSGDSPNMTDMLYMNLPTAPLATRRPLQMTLSIEKSEEPYTVRDLWDETLAYLLREVKAGAPLPVHKRMQIAQFIGGVISNSPSLKTNYDRNAKTIALTAISTAETPGEEFLMPDMPITTRTLRPGSPLSALQPATENRVKIDPMQMKIDNETSAMQAPDIYFFSRPDLDGLVYEKLSDLRQLFRRAVATTNDDASRSYYKYYLFLIDRALKME